MISCFDKQLHESEARICGAGLISFGAPDLKP
jgi:hypothetical protein